MSTFSEAYTKQFQQIVSEFDGNGDVRYFIKNYLEDSYQVRWRKGSRHFMIVPEGRFGRLIFEVGTWNLVCSDLPTLKEVNWNASTVSGEKRIIEYHDGLYVRCYYANGRWIFADEESTQINPESHTLSSDERRNVIDVVQENISTSDLDKTKTHIFCLYTPELITNYYYRDTMCTKVVAIDNITGDMEYESPTVTNVQCGLFLLNSGLLMYTDGFNISRSMINSCRNLSYIILHNYRNFDNFIRYFPIQSWIEYKSKLEVRIGKLIDEILSNQAEYPLIISEMKEKKITKITRQSILSFFMTLPTSHKAFYLGIKIY